MPAASGRALQTAVTTRPLSGATSAAGSSRCAGSRDVEPQPPVDLDARVREVLQRLAPDVEHRVGGLERVAHRARLLRVEPLGVLAVLCLGEVEVAGHAHQLVGRDRGARPAPAVGDVGLDRAEVAAAVEHDRERLAHRQAADPQRDRRRRARVDQRSAEQVVGWVLVHGGIPLEE